MTKTNKLFDLLIIEDNSAQLLLLSKIIENLGITYKTATSGEEALKMLDNFYFHIILIDVGLPGISGIETLKTIKTKAEYKNTIVILISAEDSFKTVSEGLLAGASDFIRKPYIPIEINIKIENWLHLINSKKEINALNEQLKGEKKKLSRYFSKSFSEGLASDKISTEIGGEIKDTSIMVFDLRNSTTIAESSNPKDFSQFLSEFFADLTDLIYSNKGHVINFLGDGFMATYGVPFEDDNATMNCIETAMRIRKYVESYNVARPSFLKAPIAIGIGIATGKVFAGNIGSFQNITYTILGDPANLSSRLESLTKLAKVDILLDGNTYDRVKDQIKVKKVNFERVKGKIKKVRIYYLDSIIASKDNITVF